MVVDEALVRRYFAGEDPLGKPMYLGTPGNQLEATIVGVVGDTRDAGLASDPLPSVYVPLAVMPAWTWIICMVRARVEPTWVAARAAIRELDSSLPVRDVRLLSASVLAS